MSKLSDLVFNVIVNANDHEQENDSRREQMALSHCDVN